MPVRRRLSERTHVGSAGGIVNFVDCGQARYCRCDRLVQIQKALKRQARQIVVFLTANVVGSVAGVDLFDVATCRGDALLFGLCRTGALDALLDMLMRFLVKVWQVQRLLRGALVVEAFLPTAFRAAALFSVKVKTSLTPATTKIHFVTVLTLKRTSLWPDSPNRF